MKGRTIAAAAAGRLKLNLRFRLSSLHGCHGRAEGGWPGRRVGLCAFCPERWSPRVNDPSKGGFRKRGNRVVMAL